MEREMESRTPSIIDLNAELAKLTMFRRTPQATREETKGSVARLASYRDGDHWRRVAESRGPVGPPSAIYPS